MLLHALIFSAVTVAVIADQEGLFENNPSAARTKRLALFSSFFGSGTDKRNNDDPRMFSSAFGKRSIVPAVLPEEEGLSWLEEPKRSVSFDDPRMFSGAFGKRAAKRSVSIGTATYVPRRGVLDTIFSRFSGFMPGSVQKRNYDDPRMFSSAFGKRSSYDYNDPRFYSSSFGKRSAVIDDPRMFSMAFGRRR